VTVALALCRFAHFMAAMLVFGSSAFLRLYAPAGLRGALSPRIRRLGLAASLIALATGLLWLALEAASMADDWSAAIDPDAIAALLTDTAFGRAWVVHLALAVALAAAVVLTARPRWAAIPALSGLLLASLALVGHAAMQTGPIGILHRANHALHLLMTGAWLGGLVPFILCLNAYGTDKADGRRDAVAAMMRFSFFGHFVVAAIVATGMVDITLVSGRAPLAPTTPYRALLDAKIGLVAIIVLLALVNRYALVPRLGLKPEALPALRRNSVVEVGLGTIVVALVSLFALLDPA
jgi:putative copper resistance protein D